MKFYRNTGKPGPVFHDITSFSIEETEGYLGVQLVDLFNDGRRHLVIGGNKHGSPLRPASASEVVGERNSPFPPRFKRSCGGLGRRRPPVLALRI